MGPLASRLKRAVCIVLIACLLPWQEPARAFAETPPVAAADPRAELVTATLPADVRDAVEKALSGPGGAAFIANSRTAKLPEIRALLAQIAATKNPADPAVAAARGRLDALVAGAQTLQHDWKGDAESEKAYLALLAAVKKDHADVTGQLDARTAEDPIMARLRGQVPDRPDLEGQLKSFQASLSAYLKSGSETDMASAVSSMDKIYLGAKIPDDKRAEMISQIAAAARAQGDAIAVRAGPGDGRPFTGYQGAARRVTDQGLAVPGLTSAPPANASGAALPMPTGEMRDAVGAAGTGLRETIRGGLVPAVDLRALADKAARFAERLENPDAAATEASARTVGAAYDAISNRIMQLIGQAPDAATAAPEALAAWRKIWSELQGKLLDRDGKTGADWAQAEKLWTDHPDAQANSAASRNRALELRRMLAAFVEKGIDPTAVPKALRGQLLTGDGGASSPLGIVTQALFKDQDKSGDKLKALLSRFQTMGLLSPGADPQALATFYDGAGNAALFKDTALEGLVARWAQARQQEASGTPARANQATSAELSGQVLEQIQFLGASVLAEKNDDK